MSHAKECTGTFIRELAHGGAFTDILLYGEQPQREAGAKRRIRAGMAE
ncbi:MAG: hypothetical protein KHY96_10375 [Lachnospiraceae bacterium]|nr:hypothetical protein [Lachnospiraceae bacterium]